MSIAELCAENHGVIELLRLLSAGWTAEITHVDDTHSKVNVACIDHKGETYRLRFSASTITSLFGQDALHVGDDLHFSDDMQNMFYPFALDRFMQEQSYLRFCSVKELIRLFRGRSYSAPVSETEPSSGKGLVNRFENTELVSSTAEVVTDSQASTRNFIDFQFGTEFTQSVLEDLWDEKGSKSGDEFRRHIAQELRKNLFTFIESRLKNDHTINWAQSDQEQQFTLLYNVIVDTEQAVKEHGLTSEKYLENDSGVPVAQMTQAIQKSLSDHEIQTAVHAYLDPDHIVNNPDELRTLYRAALQLNQIRSSGDLLYNEASRGSKTMHGYNAVLFVDKAYPVKDYSEWTMNDDVTWHRIQNNHGKQSLIPYVQGIMLLVEERTLREDYAATLRQQSTTLPILSVDGEPLAK